MDLVSCPDNIDDSATSWSNCGRCDACVFLKEQARSTSFSDKKKGEINF